MRGKISDQDLTDYALNELQPEERLYIESMLAVSEECRNDIYEMVEVAQLLEEGYEAEETKIPATLTREQRRELLHAPEVHTPVWQTAASIFGLAACVAFALSLPSHWETHNTKGAVAQVSTQMTKMVSHAVLPEKAELSNAFHSLRAIAEDPSRWLPSEMLGDASVVCTPPTSFE